MTIKAVLFDLDDTLFDYERCHQAASKEIFHEIHKRTKTPLELVPLLFEIAQKEVKMQLLWTAASHNKDLYFQKVFEKMNSQMKNKIMPKDILHIFDRYRKVFYATIKRERASTELLKYLKRKNIKTWIVTDSSNYTQLKKLVCLGIDDKIDVMVSSEEAGMDKPHSSPFLLAAHKLEVLARECLMVGDNILRDIDGGQRLGMQGIWINRYCKETKGVCSRYTVYTTAELFALLKKLIP